MLNILSYKFSNISYLMSFQDHSSTLGRETSTEDKRRPSCFVKLPRIFHPPNRLASTGKFPLAYFPQLLISCAQLWCSFPDERIKAIFDKSSFNINLKKLFLDQLSSHYMFVQDSFATIVIFGCNF